MLTVYLIFKLIIKSRHESLHPFHSLHSICLLVSLVCFAGVLKSFPCSFLCLSDKQAPAAKLIGHSDVSCTIEYVGVRCVTLSFPNVSYQTERKKKGKGIESFQFHAVIRIFRQNITINVLFLNRLVLFSLSSFVLSGSLLMCEPTPC